MGALVDEIAGSQPDNGNLTSAVRVACMRWLSDSNADLRKLSSIERVKALVVACPSPAFVLSSAKTIVAFNPPFQQFVRRQLLFGGEDAKRGLKLTLDVHVRDILMRLNKNGEIPVVTGFAIDAGERRYRGRLNIVRAPVVEPDLLLAFVFNG